MQVLDPLGFFFDEPEEKKPRESASPRLHVARSPSRSRGRRAPASRSRGRSASSGSEGVTDDSGEARLRRLRRRIDKYIERNRLDHRVSGIMQNMHPSDVVKVMETPFPEDCRNPSGFAVAQIRRTERDAGRPKDYRWNGRTWDEGPQDFGLRSPPGGDRGRGRERDRGGLGHSAGCDVSRGRRHCRSRSCRRTQRLPPGLHGSVSGSCSRSSSGSSSQSASCSDSRVPGRRRRH
mmetsp:Transcript_107691/g.347603  ORF Transcript_107691/g.347603 Transcript_107691/m.347603 type:complete len:235 (-) Transcript_107691:84-788(-)